MADPKLSRKALRTLTSGLLTGRVAEPMRASNFDKEEVIPLLERLGYIEFRRSFNKVTWDVAEEYVLTDSGRERAERARDAGR
jgi:hypothetical protein